MTVNFLAPFWSVPFPLPGENRPEAVAVWNKTSDLGHRLSIHRPAGLSRPADRGRGGSRFNGPQSTRNAVLKRLVTNRLRHRLMLWSYSFILDKLNTRIPFPPTYSACFAETEPYMDCKAEVCASIAQYS